MSEIWGLIFGRAKFFFFWGGGGGRGGRNLLSEFYGILKRKIPSGNKPVRK